MEELRKQLVEIINNSKLPFECVFYIVKDIYREVNDLYKDMLATAENTKTEEAEVAEDKAE